MASGSQEGPVHLSRRIREQLRNLAIVLVGAMIFSFLMSTLSSFVVNPQNGNTFAILIVTVIAATIAYVMYRVYVFAPNARLSKEVSVQIIYDRKNKLVIDDPFDGYCPQQMAWQAFERFREAASEESETLINAGVGPQDTEKHVLTEILEYLVVLSLHGDQLGFDRSGLAKDKTITRLPDGLEKNRIISFFKKMKAADIVDRGMQQLDFILPEDLEVNYESPSPKGSKDPNTFKIIFSGKRCDVTIAGKMSSHWPVSSMMTGPAPVFQNVYIRQYHHSRLLASFPGLWVAYYRIHIKGKFKLRFGLIPSLSYMDWADGWIERFVGGAPFGGFDFGELAKRNAIKTSADMYETIKRIDAKLSKCDDEEGPGAKPDSGRGPEVL